MTPKRYLEIAKMMLEKRNPNCSDGVCSTLSFLKTLTNSITWDEYRAYDRWMTSQIKMHLFVDNWLYYVHKIKLTTPEELAAYRMAWIANQIEYWEWRVEND